MLECRRFTIDGPVEIRPRRFEDERGFFSETYNEQAFAEAGLPTLWVQDNHSLSRAKGVLRGLHYQVAPLGQAKLVRASRGAVFDVAVDIRPNSRSRGRWAAVELSAAKGNQLYVPDGFAHGFLTLEEDCEVQYKVSAPYSAAHERAIRFDDPAIGIEWPDVGTLTLSPRDAAAPLLADASP